MSAFHKVRVSGITIATYNEPAMKSFYEYVFQVEFKEMIRGKYTLYTGEIGGITLLLCPASLAGNQSDQNRQQLDIIVPDLDEALSLAEKYGGKRMGDISEQNGQRMSGCYDPDGNSIVLLDA